MTDETHYGWRLTLWLFVGGIGLGGTMAGALIGDWLGFACALVCVVASIFMLGTGLWMRHPHA